MNRPLTLLPASVSSLAAAEVGEEVEVRVEMEPPLPKIHSPIGDWEVTRYPARRDWEFLHHRRSGSGKRKVIVDRFAPAAEGERVEVGCPECFGAGYYEDHAVSCDGAGCHSSCPVQTRCRTCGGPGAIPATIVSDPVPERWCEGEGCIDGYRLVPFECCDDSDCESCGGAGGDAMTEDCPNCAGSPPYAWRLTLRKDGGGDE